MAKLALLGTPGKVTVSSKEDAAKEETVVLSNESQEDAVYEENDGYLPEKILTHESVAYWDYYLTNYDENGNPRISPKKTTYNLNEEKQTHPELFAGCGSSKKWKSSRYLCLTIIQTRKKSGLTASANWSWLNTMSRRTQSIQASYLTVKRMWRTDRDALDS